MKLGIPKFGIYSDLLRSLLERTGVEVIMPTTVTRDMIQAGAANSSDMMCFPYKVTLGQEIWALDRGATDLLMFNSCGLCRLKHYHQIQEQTLRHLGYDFRMHVVTRDKFRKQIKKLFGLSFIEAMRLFRNFLPNIDRLHTDAYRFSPHRDLLIGIVGEVYTCWEPDINFNIVRKLQRMGANVDMSITVTDYMRGATHRGIEEERIARSMLSQELGGHGFESLCNTLYYARHGYDGVIHLMPLSCMPESTVEPLLDMVAEHYDLPLYRFPIDESNFEAGVNTRLETFVSMLRRKRQCQHISV